ncbi:MAG: flagellar export protein FliJ [Lachnospiraceae bacterium]|nr:flagellar export protein FliJ [Lachnospiraceae bacterium]
MKRFRYSLDTVLSYKTQVLDGLKREHAAMLKKVNDKKEEIRQLNGELCEFEGSFDETKSAGASIETYLLYDMCIDRKKEQIEQEKEHLVILKKREEKKKIEVIDAKVDTSKFEKLKDRRLQEYRAAEQKEEEAFVEEFVIHNMIAESLGYRG